MLHVRYDWRRRVAWSVFCLSLFLTSQTSTNRSTANKEDELAIVVKRADLGNLQNANSQFDRIVYFDYYGFK